MDIHQQARFHIQKVREHPVVELRSEDLHKGHAAIFSTDAERPPVCKLKGAGSDEVLCGEPGHGKPIPREGKRLLRIHVENGMQRFKTRRSVHWFSLYPEALQVVEDIKLDSLQPRLCRADAVRVDPERHILRFGQTAVSSSPLALKEAGVFRTSRIMTVVLRLQNETFRNIVLGGSEVKE